MVLDGEMTLFHENHHTNVLSKFDQDQFSGSSCKIDGGQDRRFHSWELNPQERIVYVKTYYSYHWSPGW